MTGDSRLSRLNPLYLAVRNGGAFFLCLSLGLAGGLLYQIVATPRHFVAKGSRALVAATPDAAPESDWEMAAVRFSAFPRNPERLGLLTANLRFALKHFLSAGPDDSGDPAAELRERLLECAAPAAMDTSPWDRPVPPYFGPYLALSMGDFAANIDYQSLAAILADVDPPPGRTGWDFSFFEPGRDGLSADDLVTRPGPDDRFFAVFYRVHELREGSAPFSAEAAWRSAVSELNERLSREGEFRGGGGFGDAAVRELLREFAVIPTLAANGLYGPAGRYYAAHDPAPWERDLWRGRWSAAEVGLDRTDPGRALLTLRLPNTLYPLHFPADSPMTRIDGLATEVALLYMGAVLERDAKRMADILAARASMGAEAPIAEPAPSPAPEARTPEPPPPERESEPPAMEVDAEYRARIAELERILLEAKKTRDGCALAQAAAREEADLAAREAFAARDRADRLKERLDGMEMRETELRGAPLEGPEVLELRALGQDALRRLAELRLACTEEHPFVRATLRELAAIELRLLEADDGVAAATLEERRIRVKNLDLERKIAEESAGALAERRNHAAEAAECLLADLAAAEARLSEAEHALAMQLEPRPLRIESMTLVAGNIGRLADGLAKLSDSRAAPAAPEPEPSPGPVPEPAQPAQPAPASPLRLVFSPGPSEIEVVGIPLSPRPLEIGTGLGLCLGLLWMLLHETLGSRLTNAFEARRWVGVPVLASIPRYDGRSLARGAKALGGKLEPYGGRRTLVPPSIDMTEPAPIGKRRALAFRGAFRRWRAFALGVAILLLAAGLRQIAVGDAWRMPPGARPPMFREGRR